MGEVGKGLKVLEAEVKDLRHDYNSGREKAIAAHQQIIGVLNEKMDESQFKAEFKAVYKLQWLHDNWVVIGLIVSLMIALGFLSKGERFEKAKEIISTVKDGKKINK